MRRLYAAWCKLAAKAGFNLDQPRVPAGQPDGGQWTSGEAGASDSAVRVAADKPRLGPAAIAALAAQVAKRLIEAYRTNNLLFDFFGPRGTVAVTSIDGVDHFGSNSNSPTYTTVDQAAAERMRGVLIEKYPDVMSIENIGQIPNDAVFHAEATALLRAARANGGTLAGRTIEVYTDRSMCPSCKIVLPRIALELGNPTVTFVSPSGQRDTAKNARWVTEGSR